MKTPPAPPTAVELLKTSSPRRLAQLTPPIAPSMVSWAQTDDATNPISPESARTHIIRFIVPLLFLPRGSAGSGVYSHPGAHAASKVRPAGLATIRLGMLS